MVLTHKHLPEILCIMMDPVLTVSCGTYVPFVTLLNSNKKTMCYLAGLDIMSADMKCAMVVSRGFLVLVRLQQGQLFVPNQSEKGSLSWMA